MPLPRALIDWVSPIDLSVHDRTQSLVHVIIFFGFYFGHLDIFMCCHTCSRRRYLSFIPHPVTMTPGQPRKFMVNIFPKDITTWLGQDSNPQPFGPESGVLTTRPRRPLVCIERWLYCSSDTTQVKFPNNF